MEQKVNFNDIKEKFRPDIDKIVTRNIEGVPYHQKECQALSNYLADEIINVLTKKQPALKFASTVTIFQKGECSCHFGSTCLWDPSTDGPLTAKYENDSFHVFVTVFGLAY